MPTYDYRCDTCENVFEVFQSFSEDPLSKCPKDNCGVATSGLEMSQNSLRMSWTREEVDQKLEGIMVNIHKNAFETAEKYGMPGNYVAGANIAGFLKIAESTMAQGIL